MSGEPCSPTPGMIPTGGIPTELASTGPLVMSLFQRLVRTDQPESTKRALALMAGSTLCACLALLTLAVWYQALVDHAVDGGLVTALGLLSASVAGLAGAAYRKQETPPAGDA